MKLGGYLNDVTLYAQYEQYHHIVNFYINDTITNTLTADGGTNIIFTGDVPVNPNNSSLKFLGFFDNEGKQVFDKNLNSIDGEYFTNGA